MSRVYIKFPSKEDRIEGLYTLLRQTSVEGLPGNVFGISEEDLPILKNSQAKFDIASPEEVQQSYREFREVWNIKTRKKELRKKIKEVKSQLKHLTNPHPL